MVDKVQTMRRQLVSTGTMCEEIIGFSRAVRVGPWVSVAATSALDPDGPVGGSDVVAQTKETLRRIQLALEEVGASIDDVVRTQIFVADIECWKDVGRVHAEFFAGVLPANTTVQAGLGEQLLVEISADAVIADG